jgi:hypothetical protein
MNRFNFRPTQRVGDRLANLNQRARRLRERQARAEVLAAYLNYTVDELSTMGMLPPAIVLGPVIREQSLDANGHGLSNGRLVQAAVLVPEGLGVVLWDVEDYAELSKQPGGLESEARMQFVPFSRCAPAIRGLLDEHIGDLLTRLQRLT